MEEKQEFYEEIARKVAMVSSPIDNGDEEQKDNN